MKTNGYIIIIAPEGYTGKKYSNKYCYEHHAVWWKMEGSIVPKGFGIHHINGNKSDNRIENLQLVTRSEHASIHGKDRSIASVKYRRCPECGKEFVQRKRPVQKFCSRKCIGEYNFPRRKKEALSSIGKDIAFSRQ